MKKVTKSILGLAMLSLLVVSTPLGASAGSTIDKKCLKPCHERF
ncbi:hypothetical protein [Rummeliibacillus sp. BSL5]